MEFKINNSIPEEKVRLTIGTHGGTFSSKEVVATALLYLLHKDNYDISLVRTDEESELQMCDVRLTDGCPINVKTGITYTKIYDIWNDSGIAILHVVNHYMPSCSLWYNAVWHELLDEFSLLDSEGDSYPYFKFISDFVPAWDMSQHFNKAFSDVLSITVCILERHIKQALSKYFSRQWNQSISDIKK